MSNKQTSKLVWVIRKGGSAADKSGSYEYWSKSAETWMARGYATTYTVAQKDRTKLPTDGMWVQVYLDPKPVEQQVGNPGNLTRVLAGPGECTICWAKMPPKRIGHCDRCMNIYPVELLAACEGPAVPRGWRAIVSTGAFDFASCAIDGGDWVILHDVRGYEAEEVGRNVSVRLDKIVAVMENPSVKRGKK